MYDESSWQEFRAEALALAKNRVETVLQNWLDKIGYVKPVGYYLNYIDHTMEIYTTNIGRLIGRAGANVTEFEKMLSDEYHEKWNVKFIEIRGGFVNVNK